MKKKKPQRSQWVTIRLQTAEAAKLRQLYSRTTARSLSEYARAVLLRKPVMVTYRNASADSFLEEMIGLKTALSAIEKHLHTALQQLPSAEQVPAGTTWFLRHELYNKQLQVKTEQILDKLTEIYNLWLQK